MVKPVLDVVEAAPGFEYSVHGAATAQRGVL
jgi:hypothetical protein